MHVSKIRDILRIKTEKVTASATKPINLRGQHLRSLSNDDKLKVKVSSHSCGPQVNIRQAPVLDSLNEVN